MFKKKSTPDFQGEADIAPVPEMPPVSSEDLHKEFNPTPPTKSKLWLFISIGIAVVVIGIGGVVFANYQGYLDISFLPSKNDGVVDEMLVAMEGVEKAKYKVDISFYTEPWDGIHEPFDIPDNTNSSIPIDINTVTGTDIKLELDIESYFDGTTDLEATNGYIKLGGIYGIGTEQMGLEIEFKKVGADLYGVLNDYPELFASFVPQLEELKGKWIKISADGEYGEYFDIVYDNSDIISDENYVTDYDYAFETGFIKLGKKLASEVLDGQSTMHYEVDFDLERLEDMYIQMALDVAKLQNEASTEALDDLPIESLEDIDLASMLTPEIKATIETIIDNSNVEIWIGEGDNVLRQLKITTIIVAPEDQRTPEIGQARMEILLSLSNINETMEVLAPQTSITIDELMEIFSPEVDTIDTDEDGLCDADEEKYGTDINNPDTDGDGYLDGAEVEAGYNPNGEGELPMIIELNTTSLDAFGIEVTSSEKQITDCEFLGGVWTIVNASTEEECSVLEDYDNCEANEGCNWDYLEISGSDLGCIPIIDYCGCENGNTYFYGCDSDGFGE